MTTHCPDINKLVACCELYACPPDSSGECDENRSAIPCFNAIDWLEWLMKGHAADDCVCCNGSGMGTYSDYNGRNSGGAPPACAECDGRGVANRFRDDDERFDIFARS